MCGRGLESIRGEWFAIRVTLGKVMTPHLGAVKRAREVIWPTRPTSWTKTKTPPFMKVEKLLGFGVCGPAIFWPPRKQTPAHVYMICGKSARAVPEGHDEGGSTRALDDDASSSGIRTIHAML